MIIIGLNAYHADASAAIFVNGVMVAAFEEERFTRIKHWAGFPAISIQHCLQEAGVGFKDVDYFAIGRDPSAKLIRKMKYVLSDPFRSFKTVAERFSNSQKARSLEKELSVISGLPASHFKSKIKNVEHHRSHLASAFFVSPFEKAAVLSIDGSGDFTTTMVATGRDTKLKVLASVDFPHSIGIFYTAFTQLLGFPHYGDEYKIMGMAPYGEARYVSQMQDVVKLKPNGFFALNLAYFRKGTSGIISYNKDHVPAVAPLYSKLMLKHFGRPRDQEEPLSQYHKDIAASVQKMTELVFFHVLNALHEVTGEDNLCLAGGVAQNSVAIGKITTHTPFKRVYVPSAGSDAGIASGSALYVQHQLLDMPRLAPSYSAFTGSIFTNDSIRDYLDSNGYAYTHMCDEELYTFVTTSLIAGGVIGWMSGRAEFGPRALGGRSILADPRRADARDLINSKIKRRENFRPFAPSVLKEYVAEYFDINEMSPFMERVLPIKKDKQSEIPAVTHVDGTGRLQTVDKEVSPRYYALIEAFRKQTGVPMLLNTSFNENEPIVNTPREALDCFLRTDMDMLVLENIVITKR